MNCKNCGLELPADAAFCLSCGTKVEAPQKVTETLMLAPGIKAEVGNFFVKKNYAYFLTHGFCFGAHSKLWRMDLRSKQSICLIDYDTLGVSLQQHTFSEQSDYPLLYADEHIISAVLNNKDELEYLCYNLRENRLMELGQLSLPIYLSMDGEYFYNVSESGNGIDIEVKTIAQAFRGMDGKCYSINETTASELYAKYASDNPQFSTDITIYHDTVLTRLFGPEEIPFVALPFRNPNKGYLLGNYLSASPEIFAYEDMIVVYNYQQNCYQVHDICEKTQLCTIPAEDSLRMMQFRSSLYFASQNPALCFDFISGQTYTLPQYHKAFVGGLKHDIICTDEGAYLYRYSDSVTELFYLDRNELFSACSEDAAEELLCHPLTCCNFVREFVPSLRDSARDANIYTIQNTEELCSCMENYLRKNGLSPRLPFYGRNYLTLPDGNRIGFCYGHTPTYQNAQNFSYNLYQVDAQGNAVFLNAGSIGGIESLTVYKNFVYWEYFNTIYRYDFNTGIFSDSSQDASIAGAYQTIAAKAPKTFL